MYPSCIPSIETKISIYSAKGYEMVKYFSTRTLNPLLARYFFVNFDIKPKSNIFLESIDAKSASV